VESAVQLLLEFRHAVARLEFQIVLLNAVEIITSPAQQIRLHEQTPTVTAITLVLTPVFASHRKPTAYRKLTRMTKTVHACRTK
jgi:hypothetical protein